MSGRMLGLGAAGGCLRAFVLEVNPSSSSPTDYHVPPATCHLPPATHRLSANCDSDIPPLRAVEPPGDVPALQSHIRFCSSVHARSIYECTLHGTA
jgi:hypothetical protein